MPKHRLTDQVLESEGALRALIGEPKPLVPTKIIDHVNGLTRRFIELSPLVCLGTADADGNCDVSPRGDAPGFVRILDERTLLMPERPGNRIADSLRNMLDNPHVGVIFIVPGVGDTFRVNGRATLTTDPALLGPSAVDGKPPKLGILIDIDEAYTQCSKAFIRSDLWNGAHFVDRAQLPTVGQIMKSIHGEGFDAQAHDAERDARYARGEGLY